MHCNRVLPVLAFFFAALLTTQLYAANQTLQAANSTSPVTKSTAKQSPPAPEQLKQKKIYSTKQLNSKTLELIPNIHLIPPGSMPVHQNVSLEDILAMNDKVLTKDANVTVNFFQSRLQKELGATTTLKLVGSVFNVYRDFTGRMTTDLLSLTYEIKK